MRALSLSMPEVHSRYCGDTGFIFKDKLPPAQTKLEYFNYTGRWICVMTPGGMITEVPPCEKDSHEGLEGSFVINEATSCGNYYEANFIHCDTLTGCRHSEAQREKVKHLEESKDKLGHHTVAHGVTLKDLLASTDGILIPATMTTVFVRDNSRTHVNLAVQNKYTIEKEKAGAGLQFRYVSKDHKSVLYLVFGNTVIKAKAACNNVKDDFIEVYTTLDDGTVQMTDTITMEKALKEGFKGTRVFISEAEAIVYRDKHYDAVSKNDALKTEISRITETNNAEIQRIRNALEQEKEAHLISRRRHLDDESRSKATIWGKTSAVFSSIASLFSTAWSVIKNIF